ncbi:6426_t:CDS:2 [Ambispora gerdemannii]|uniref:6426_t:CDS:1 n=1 Tax=Ambispora gerdemannii TaxID=144530 RepID=A0A9N8WQI0_9GLOM|nr:6426_t:CDS:2 [Ambispora gerdemannii]
MRAGRPRSKGQMPVAYRSLTPSRTSGNQEGFLRPNAILNDKRPSRSLPPIPAVYVIL